MTHPTPTATTSASPPPRGEGLGVGGLALALTIALTAPATAQIIPTGSPAADILLTQALGEQRLFLTCTALMGETHGLIADIWARDVAAAAALLAEDDVPAPVIAAFTAAASPDSLLPAPDTSFEDVRQFCSTDPDWLSRLNRMEMINLSRQLPEALK